MFALRFVTRGAARFGAQLRSPAFQRRMNSTAENSWAKDRQHTKDHAAGTTGEQYTHWHGGVGYPKSWSTFLTGHRPLAEDLFLVRSSDSIPALPRVIYWQGHESDAFLLSF